MTHQPEDVAGPYIVWENYGSEGWQPKSYKELGSALLAQRFTDSFVITKRVYFQVEEKQ